jgi:hypothetical protein
MYLNSQSTLFAILAHSGTFGHQFGSPHAVFTTVANKGSSGRLSHAVLQEFDRLNYYGWRSYTASQKGFPPHIMDYKYKMKGVDIPMSKSYKLCMMKYL